ncbi:hypothetical protein [Photorhabdus noenieputensis]|uniref:hypothetical protein n=1 Tax=Photorhabdus noenieputensis TaxID=1208607 RepID=UPI001BD4662C|nr:hypothetical protein [Photorhabdus noenieputensis]MCK3670340.1 hypothetical protein [Photorhabdus noenieputensis]
MSLPTGQSLHWNQRGELQQVTTINRDDNSDNSNFSKYTAACQSIRLISIILSW